MSKEKETTEAKPEKLVRIRALRDCAVMRNKREMVIKKGKEMEVTEEEAKMLCDKTFPGYHPFYGHMPEIGPLMGTIGNPLERRTIVRAQRVA